jgi:hypothetical protein
VCGFGLGKVREFMGWAGGDHGGKRGWIVMTGTDGYVCGNEDGMGVGTLEL